jgi:uncharacterized protein
MPPSSPPPAHPASTSEILAATRLWIDRAVIGLNLCPFAKPVYSREQIRYVVTPATSEDELLSALEAELHFLVAADPAAVETTLLIHPRVLGDFLDYNDFLSLADDLLERLDLEGVIQIASFHPLYQFAGTSADDPTNRTNRSPFPLLHLLREASVTKAVAAFPEASEIYERNIETMRRLGEEGWAALWEETGEKPAGHG